MKLILIPECRGWRSLFIALVVAVSVNALSLDSLKERVITTFDLLPDYTIEFEMSAFMLHQNSFQKRNFLAEPHPRLQFCFLSYKDIIASVWDVDFQFGLGELPDNVVFTVLDVQFGIEPAIQVKVKDVALEAGIAHRCIHEIDRKDFPVVHFNRLFLCGGSDNFGISNFWTRLRSDTMFTCKSRIAWEGEFSYYLKEFFGVVSTNKLNGNSASVWDAAIRGEYAFAKRKSWIFTASSSSTYGIYDPQLGFAAKQKVNWYGEQIFGCKAYFSRGVRGACFFVDYYLDNLPVPLNQPAVAQGTSRFSKNRMIQAGLIFFN